MLVSNPPLDFSGTVENLGGALLRVANEPSGDGGRDVWFWLAAYGRPAAEMDALQARWAAHLRTLFPEAK